MTFSKDMLAAFSSIKGRLTRPGEGRGVQVQLEMTPPPSLQKLGNKVPEIPTFTFEMSFRLANYGFSSRWSILGTEQ